MSSSEPSEPTTEERILDATIGLLGRNGLAGVSMRGVAREAGVAVGLANYHFTNKVELVCAALRRIGERDLDIVEIETELEPADALEASLRRVFDPDLLSAEYLSLRLQLWSLAGVDDRFAEINRTAQERYLDGVVALLRSARPDLESAEARRRATDILVVQNGVWLTAVLIADREAIDRALERTMTIAFD